MNSKGIARDEGMLGMLNFRCHKGVTDLECDTSQATDCEYVRISCLADAEVPQFLKQVLIFTAKAAAIEQ